jgi:hypothetical protein
MQGKKPKARTKRPSQTSPARVVLDREAVARLAYELYVQRGREPGHDAEDWLTAEQTLLKQSRRSYTRRPAAKVSRRTEDKSR